MALTMTERRSVTRELAKDYARSGRAKKVEILARLAELTGYNRNYLARRLGRCTSTRAR